MAESESPRADAAGLVYFNGELLPASAARLPVDDAGVLYGMGFFETFRTSGGQPHHWKFHQARLAQACATAGIAVPAAFLARDEARLRENVRALLREHQSGEAVFRYTLTAGRAAAGEGGVNFAQPSEVMTVRAVPAAAPAEGVLLRVLRLARDNGEWLPRPKSLNYANALAGASELRRRSAAASDEGLFLSRDGRWVVETARQNIAWIEGDQFCHPDPALGAVDGTCLQWARQRGLTFAERRINLGGLLAADAVIVLNSVRGISPVREIWDEEDRVRLRSFDGRVHPLVAKLQEDWNDALRATAASGAANV